MRSAGRFLSNSLFIFLSNLIVKASDSLLFILIGRSIGPDDAGVFNLGKTYLVILITLSAWGLHELLVRELAPRREQSKRYLVNYLLLRVVLATATYAVMLLILQLNLPYSQEAKTVIRILTLAIFPEAIYSVCQAFFIAHEKMTPPLASAVAAGAIKLGAGYWLLLNGASVIAVAWVIPIATTISLLAYVPSLIRLLRVTPAQVSSKIDLRFSLAQLRFAPGFIIIGIFATLDFQTDSVLISLLLNEASLGWYGAAQTIMLGFWLMPLAIRTSLYPIMARYHQEDDAKLTRLYRKTNRYLVIAALPIATTVTIFARPIIRLVFGDQFDPAVPALQIMIWAVVFAFLDVPNARLMLVFNHQSRTGWITGISMAANVGLNLWLTPRYGIIGASVARTTTSFIFFLLIYLYIQSNFIRDSLLPLLIRPAIAALAMALVMWQLRHVLILWPVLAGLVVYAAVILLAGAIPAGDLRFFPTLPWQSEQMEDPSRE